MASRENGGGPYCDLGRSDVEIGLRRGRIGEFAGGAHNHSAACLDLVRTDVQRTHGQVQAAGWKAR